jgi:hypothetical protein
MPEAPGSDPTGNSARQGNLEIVRQFGSHWRQVCPARFQHHHNELQAMLVDEFVLAENDSTAIALTAEHAQN